MAGSRASIREKSAIDFHPQKRYKVVAIYATRMVFMEMIPYRDLRNKPSAVRRKLEKQGELIVTVDGKPFAVMIDLSNNETFEETLVLISRILAQMAVRSIRSQARRAGLKSMRSEEINKIIAATRERQA